MSKKVWFEWTALLCPKIQPCPKIPSVKLENYCINVTLLNCYSNRYSPEAESRLVLATVKASSARTKQVKKNCSKNKFPTVAEQLVPFNFSAVFGTINPKIECVTDTKIRVCTNVYLRLLCNFRFQVPLCFLTHYCPRPMGFCAKWVLEKCSIAIYVRLLGMLACGNEI